MVDVEDLIHAFAWVVVPLFFFNGLLFIANASFNNLDRASWSTWTNWGRNTLGVLPLIMPPFVGAVAMQLIFGRNGSVNLLLNDWFGFTVPIMDGLIGVTFVESIHYFPFILLNLVASMRNIDGAMEESALNLGARGWRLFRRVIFPLAMPGYLAGATLVFVKVFDDLGTPLVMGVTNMLAPQAYLRITSVGIDDPQGYVISVIMIAFSILALGLAARVMKGRDYSTLQKGGNSLQRRRLSA